MIQIAKYQYCVVRNLLTQQLQNKFTPTHLQIVNESHKHSVPKNSETHFKITIVSEQFKDLPLIQRHRSVFAALNDLKEKHKIHALSMNTKTVDEWEKCEEVGESPLCKGGSKQIYK